MEQKYKTNIIIIQTQNIEYMNRKITWHAPNLKRRTLN